ncbi:thiamine diphosphokinase [Furfurilactobacillus milii]|uniref:Thiamine diphosphokinase n=1 Tax=Furfurilactobacillus milii TaxID=2888272 RepID=A0ABT6D9V3_9LACO|nr:thiamine diphosphokinase [Furfurilactobacillus milii]QLE66649.1 thiamine pyrophosphokinase [Furfurilactobacillus rossiae]MCF6160100.1 thiamine diphosphokinase [Furfurilactobacillus milii]MCF6162351.1 thiamine diphosphokinase [Furfurilactobacillus milii]MCF6419871.1 thiamine diphosphokinase [Furfurilactobacillus milii]MDF9913062.1 thiamine diphosphokinase [Furfurilactobacillus milii]
MVKTSGTLQSLERLNILVGGPQSEWPDDLVRGAVSGPWIGVDRGAIRLLQLGITPLIALGDFDSSTDEEFGRVRKAVSDLRQVGSAKDETDTQMGVSVAMTEFDAHEIFVYGATGGRLDHLLANVFLPLEPRYRAVVNRLTYVDRQNTMRFYVPGTYQLQRELDKRYLAFVTFGPVRQLTLPDERYHLDHADITRPVSFASNEFMGDTASFSFTSGIVGVIQSRDLKDNRAERYDLNA